MLKLGVIGTNFVSSWLCEAARSLDTVTLSAVYSRTKEKGEAFAKAEGVLHTYTDLDSFFSSGIEAVYIASPTFCHFDMAIAAIGYGLHVLLEKPMVTHKWQFDELVLLARERGVVLMEAMRPQHDEAALVIKNALKELGTIRRATMEFCQYSSRYDRFLSGEVLNAFDPKIAGAALLDIGIYTLYWVTALFGRPETVTASSTFLHNGFEGGGTVLFGYGDFQVTMAYSKICQSGTPSVIVGEKGALTFDKPTSPDKIILALRGDTPRELMHPQYENNLVCELRDFVSLCKGGENPYLVETELLYETLERVYEAAGLTIEI